MVIEISHFVYFIANLGSIHWVTLSLVNTKDLHQSLTPNQWRSHGGAQVGTCPPYLGQGGSWDLHKFEEFFWRSRGGGEAYSAWAWTYALYLLWTHHENAFVHCRLYMHIWLLGALPSDLHQGSAPGTLWETSIPKSLVPTLPPNPGYATAPKYQFNTKLMQKLEWR